MIDRLRSLLPKNKLIRGTAILASSNALGQALALAAAPVLTRLYSPEDFGLLAVYMALTAVLAVVLSLRYELAIPLPETDREAIAVVSASFVGVAGIFLIGCLAVATLRDEIAEWLNAPAIADMLWLLPASILLLGTFNVCRYWCIRQKAFAPVGKARLAQVISSLAIQLSASSFGAIGLLCGQVANQGAGSLSLGKRVLAARKQHSVTLADLRAAFVRYRRFPLISTWGALLNRISWQMPAILFAAFFGATVAGFYALSMRILNAPASTIGGAVLSTFHSTAAERARAGTLGPLVERGHATLSKFAMPPLLLVAILAPDVFGFAFGVAWIEAGDIARWIAVLTYFSMSVAPLVVVFTVLERQWDDLFCQITLFGSRLTAILLGARMTDALTTVALYAIVSGLCYLGILLLLAWRADARSRVIISTLISSISLAFGICLPAAIGALLLDNRGAWFVGALVSSALLALHLYRLGRQITGARKQTSGRES